MQKETSNYNMVDLIKWICSIFVIAIHSRLFLDTSSTNLAAAWLSYPLFQSAVPFFFIVSTFFIGKKIIWNQNSNENYEVLEKNALRMLKMYLIWILIYLMPTTYQVFTKVDTLSAKEKIWYLVLTIFMGGNIYSAHLWFLLGFGISLSIILFACGKKLSNLKWVFISSIVMYGIRVFAGVTPIQTDDKFFGLILETFQFLLFSSLFYCVIGLVFAKYEIFFFERIKLPVKVILLIMGYLLSIAFPSAPLSQIVLHLALPLLMLSIRTKGNKVFLIFRKLSTVVYLIHMLVLTILTNITGEKLGTTLFLLTVIVSNILALIYIMAKKHLSS
jgi:hypothetical protein